MAKTLTKMPSSINTTSTEDSQNSPNGNSRFRPVDGDSPVTSASSPDASPREAAHDYNKIPPHHYDKYNVKRKRTSSVEGGQSPRRYDYSPPKRVEQQHMAGQALHVLGDAQPSSFYSPNGDGRPGHWESREQSESNTVRTTEDGHQDDNSVNHYSTPPPGHAGQVTDSTGSPPSRPGGPVVQLSKRKRNFSNRTKTGCMTCRQRKKKCDEARPICNNCSRGAFECKGYTAGPGVWQKSNDSKRPVPLQSKESTMEVAYKNIDEPTSAHPSHHNNATQHAAPIDTHVEAVHSQYPQHPESRGRSSYSGQPWPPQQGHPSYTNDHLPPLSELARPDTSKPEYSAAPPPPPPPPPPREMSRPPAQSIPPPVPPAPNPQSGHWPPPTQSDYRTSYHPPKLDTQPAPSMRVPTSTFDYQKPGSGYDYQKSGAKTFTVEEVEKSRMLRHTNFNYFDPTLKNERQRCAGALARYNNACMLSSGVTEQEAQTMLMKVFDPTLDVTHHPVAPCKEKGVLGPGVKIEGPFKCTYGYNLKIMDKVFIGENTKIDDSALVQIGARTWIGPNVTILTTDVNKDVVDRKGTESTCFAAPVIIHSEVVIGSNAVIYPGVILGRGSTVEPFALVRDHLGEHQVQRAAVGPRAA